MRRFIPSFAALSLAACAGAPQPAPVAQQAVQPDPSGLVGLSPNQLVSKLGSPALQVREGNGLKLQFRNSRCVIDAYLYPVRGGEVRVEHIDTRAPSGIDANEVVCVNLFQNGAN